MTYNYILRTAVDGKDIESLADKRRGHVVLGGQGIAAGDVHLGSAGRKDLAKMGGLGLQMNAEGYFQPLEGQFAPKILFYAVQKRHMIPDPLYLKLSAFPEIDVSDVVCHWFKTVQGVFHLG